MSVSKPTPSTQRPTPRLFLVGAIVIVLGFLAPMLIKSTPPPTTTVVADTATPTELSANPTPEGPSPTTLMLKMIVGIGVTAMLCVGLTRLLKAQQPIVPRGPFEVLATLSIPGPCVVHLVRVGERKLLIGTDLTGVKAVLELPGNETSIVGPIPVAVAMPDSVLNETLARR